ncbi:DUF6457 domain-containing protein [Dactylosporangium sp. CA-092794]|uniref:DUF6457 domain-containing protein n=1 Tax=Dactylosporangium sp. CA-092794 TaxID=3239929 RepID=UPI003D9125B4
MSENALEGWLAEVAEVLGVEAIGEEERDAVLGLARDVAHNVARPGAPLTAFLLGIAVGRGADLQRTREELGRLAARAG